MVKYLSVDWLAQSHYSTTPAEREAVTDTVPSHRPHVPCMVQPRPPTFGKGYLQLKSKPSKSYKHTDPTESSSRQESDLCSPLLPTNCTSPISETSGYSSGYESEAASPECLSVDERSEVEREGSQRRMRTKFTAEQIAKLEKIFNKRKYLDAGERVKTAQKLNLSEIQVRTWFQNRRMKLKREVQDFLAPQVPPVMFQPLARVQYHSMAGQRLHHYPAGPALYPAPAPQLVLHQQPPPHHHPQLTIHNLHFY